LQTDPLVSKELLDRVKQHTTQLATHIVLGICLGTSPNWNRSRLL